MGKSAKLWPVGGQKRPSFDELLNRTRELKPIFREAARDTEPIGGSRSARCS